MNQPGRLKKVHRTLGGNQLCELILLDSERHEILQAYERAQAKRHPYPCLAVQIFVRNVRDGACAPVYRAHAADLLQFAHDYKIEWLEERIVQEYRADRDARKDSRCSLREQDARLVRGANSDNEVAKDENS